MKLWDAEICMHGGPDQREGLEAIGPNPTARNSAASLIQTDTAKGPWEVGSIGPDLAGPTHSSKDLTFTKLLATSDSQGFS